MLARVLGTGWRVVAWENRALLVVVVVVLLGDVAVRVVSVVVGASEGWSEGAPEMRADVLVVACFVFQNVLVSTEYANAALPCLALFCLCLRGDGGGLSGRQGRRKKVAALLTCCLLALPDHWGAVREGGWEDGSCGVGTYHVGACFVW